MIKAEELALKYDKELNKTFRSESAIERRLVRLAKAGLQVANLSISPKSMLELREALEKRGYMVRETSNRSLEIKW